MVDFLNTAFAEFDGRIFAFTNNLAVNAGGFFTPLCKTITFLGEKGIIFFAAAVILMLFAKTRKLGICMFGAVACGALITSFILKDAIARPRPFESSMLYANYWSTVGRPVEDGFSFPSGHMTAISAASVVLFILCNKKWSWVGFVGVIFMGFSRIYLIAHYPTDVFAGIIVGAVSGVIAYYITKLIYYFLEKYNEASFCQFVLEFDLIECLKRR